MSGGSALDAMAAALRLLLLFPLLGLSPRSSEAAVAAGSLLSSPETGAASADSTRTSGGPGRSYTVSGRQGGEWAEPSEEEEEEGCLDLWRWARHLFRYLEKVFGSWWVFTPAVWSAEPGRVLSGLGRKDEAPPLNQSRNSAAPKGALTSRSALVFHTSVPLKPTF